MFPRLHPHLHSRITPAILLATTFLLGGVATPADAQENTPVAAQQKESPPVLDSLILNPELWETSAEGFVSSQKHLGFRWNSVNKDSAQTTRKGSTCFGLPICQTVIRMNEGKIAEAMVLFYNRGDMGEISRSDYEALIEKASEAISVATGVPATARGRDASSAVKADGRLWQTEKSTFLLEYSAVKEEKARGVPFRAEFIRLEVTPKEEPKTAVQLLQEKREPFNPANHVSRDLASGDVEITGIPMVDQGPKGYCVVASAERVFRYFERRVDANELAQLANSTADGGTNVQAMTDSLKSLTARLKIRVRVLIEMEYNETIKMLEEYNRNAKRAKKSGVPMWGNNVTLTEVYARMDPDVLRATRTKSKAQITRFERLINTQIDKGLPLMWSVMLGVMPESKRSSQTVGGHMRLITGYNSKTGELIYSDSWGLGHESKRMPLVDAWSITKGLASVEPF